MPSFVRHISLCSAGWGMPWHVCRIFSTIENVFIRQCALRTYIIWLFTTVPVRNDRAFPQDVEGDCWQCRTARNKAPTHLESWRSSRTLPLEDRTSRNNLTSPPFPSTSQRWRIGKQFCGRQFCSIYFYDCASLAQASAVGEKNSHWNRKGTRRKHNS